MNMKEFERFNNIMDASIDKVVTDHLNKLSDIEYCVTTIQNIIANGGNTETLLTYATECVRTIKDEIEYFNSIDNIITSNLKELEELKGRNRQLKEINQKTLDTFKEIVKEKDNKIEELNEKIGKLTSENNSMSEIKLNYEDIKSGIEDISDKVEVNNKKICDIYTKISCIETLVTESSSNEECVKVEDIRGLNNSISDLDKKVDSISDRFTEVCNSSKKCGKAEAIEKLNETLNKIVCYINDNIEDEKEIDDISNKLCRLYDKIIVLEEVKEMIDENAKALTFSRKLTNKELVDDMKGDKHPRYKNNVNNDELIKDYESGMILRELSEKYGMTIQGIKNRLISLGVYKKVYKK